MIDKPVLSCLTCATPRNQCVFCHGYSLYQIRLPKPGKEKEKQCE